MYNPVVEKRRIADEDQELSVFVQLKKKKGRGLKLEIHFKTAKKQRSVEN